MVFNKKKKESISETYIIYKNIYDAYTRTK